MEILYGLIRAIFYIAVIFALFAVVVWRETRIQNAYERKTKEEWDAMSEQEKAESGRESMYC